MLKSSKMDLSDKFWRKWRITVTEIESSKFVNGRRWKLRFSR